MRNSRQGMWAQLRKFVNTATDEEMKLAIARTELPAMDADVEVARYAMEVRLFLLEELRERAILGAFPG